MPLNTVTLHMADDYMYEFFYDPSFPTVQVDYKGTTLHRYIYTLPQNGFHMEVFMRHNAEGTPDLIHTITLDPIGMFPLVAELLETAKGVPSRLAITKASHSKLASYNFEAYYA